MPAKDDVLRFFPRFDLTARWDVLELDAEPGHEVLGGINVAGECLIARCARHGARCSLFLPFEGEVLRAQATCMCWLINGSASEEEAHMEASRDARRWFQAWLRSR